MKNLLITLALGLSLSVVAQDKPQGDIRATKVESTGNQILPTNSQSSTPVVTPSNPVQNNTQVEDINYRDEQRENDYNRDYYRYDRGNNIDNVYEGRYYTPPTRNEMRYRQGQQCFTEFELNIRPFTLLNGYYGAGLELSTSCKASFLFDFNSGRSTLFDLQATSGMVGFRLYSKTGMVGRYASLRARARSYENGDYFGGNLSLMAGYKANWDGVTLSGEVGLGYQGADGVYITLPTWAITLGYKL
jgi:hypothetical protein